VVFEGTFKRSLTSSLQDILLIDPDTKHVGRPDGCDRIVFGFAADLFLILLAANFFTLVFFLPAFCTFLYRLAPFLTNAERSCITAARVIGPRATGLFPIVK